MSAKKNIDAAQWITAFDNNCDVVITSRVRIARNFSKIPFPMKATPEQMKEVAEAVKKAMKATKSIGPCEIIELDKISQKERQLLVEQHLSSPQHIEKPENRLLILNRDRTVSIMVNEEDHLRIQAIVAGFQLDEAFKLATDAEDALEETLEYAFDERLGYLCACPTNVGTGLRASVMLHLPALSIQNVVGQVLGTVPKVGLTIRGIFGEGTESSGNLVQMSNQVTLGRTEEEIVAHLIGITKQVVEKEKEARTVLLNTSKRQLEDRLNRAYGVMKSARLITTEEAIRLLSEIKLGADLGMIEGLRPNLFSELLVNIMPGHVLKNIENEVEPIDRDWMRAQMIREKLNNTSTEDRGSEK